MWTAATILANVINLGMLPLLTFGSLIIHYRIQNGNWALPSPVVYTVGVRGRKHLSATEAKTKEIAAELMSKYQDLLSKGALLLALEGELGAGKTVFAKGIGVALGIKRPIRSPSFILVAEHPFLLGDVRGRLYHVDLWRVGSEEEVRQLKIEEMIKPGNVVLVEWAQKFPKLIKELGDRGDLKVVRVKFAHRGKDQRDIQITNY